MPEPSAELPDWDYDTSALTSTAIVDSRLECPRCQYNLTGLLGDRCPECGTVIDWPALRAGIDIDDDRPGTHWERARWWFKPVGFVLTTLRAALMPWALAADLRARPAVAPAIAYLILCLAAGVGIPYYTTNAADRDILPPWAFGVFCYLVLQTLLFGFALPVRRTAHSSRFSMATGPDASDLPPVLRMPHSLRFWLAVGAYTSYPLLIEGFYEPPCLLPFEGDVNIWPLSLAPRHISVPATVLYYVWWLGLLVIACVRLPRGRRHRVILIIVAVPVLTLIATFAAFLAVAMFIKI